MQLKFPKIFYLLLLITACTFLIFHFSFGDVNAVLMFNHQNTPFLDQFFKYFTYLGEAFCVVFVLLFLIIKKNWVGLKHTFFILLGAISFNLFFKFVLFKAAPRPRKMLDNDALIHFIEGVDVHLINSFPSGHTLMASVCAAIIAFWYGKSGKIQIVCYWFCTTVALSRVYLFQHFFIDVATSMLFALFWTGLLMYFFNRKIKYETV